MNNSSSTIDKPSVLVLDDEPEIGELIEMFLIDEFKVTTFNDPRIACDVIRNQIFDLIISDMRMPYLTGLDVLKVVKQVRPGTPFVLISGHAQSEQERKYVMELGASGILAKPFGEPTKLSHYFREMVEQSRLASEPKSPAKHRILVIDDEEGLLEVISAILEDDYHVDCVSDASNISDMLKYRNYAAILTDLSMPKIRGKELVLKIKELVPNTPIILMTGSSKSDAVVLDALAAGALDVVTKPFPSFPEFILLLRKYIK